MTPRYAAADTTEKQPFNRHLSWLLPSVLLISSLMGAAFLAAFFGLLGPRDSEAIAVPEGPVFGTLTPPSPAIGERPFAYLEFDWPTSGVPGFEPLRQPYRFASDSSAK